MYLNFAYICHMSIKYERQRERQIYIEREIDIYRERDRYIYRDRESEIEICRERERNRETERETEIEKVRKDNSKVTIDRIVIVVSYRNMIIYNITLKICF